MTTIELVLIGTLTVTSYRPIPEQTRPECVNRHNCDTAIGDGITKYGCAVSQDLIAEGHIQYGDVLLVPGYGYRVVNDTMNKRITRAIDLMVFTKAQEKQVGVRQLQIYRIGRPHER